MRSLIERNDVETARRLLLELKLEYQALSEPCRRVVHEVLREKNKVCQEQQRAS